MSKLDLKQELKIIKETKHRNSKKKK